MTTIEIPRRLYDWWESDAGERLRLEWLYWAIEGKSKVFVDHGLAKRFFRRMWE